MQRRHEPPRRRSALAAGILYPFLGFVPGPTVAAVAMSLSSFSVIANALRLRTVNL